MCVFICLLNVCLNVQFLDYWWLILLVFGIWLLQLVECLLENIIWFMFCSSVVSIMIIEFIVVIGICLFYVFWWFSLNSFGVSVWLMLRIGRLVCLVQVWISCELLIQVIVLVMFSVCRVLMLISEFLLLLMVIRVCLCRFNVGVVIGVFLIGRWNCLCRFRLLWQVNLFRLLRQIVFISVVVVVLMVQLLMCIWFGMLVLQQLMLVIRCSSCSVCCMVLVWVLLSMNGVFGMVIVLISLGLLLKVQISCVMFVFVVKLQWMKWKMVIWCLLKVVMVYLVQRVVGGN